MENSQSGQALKARVLPDQLKKFETALKGVGVDPEKDVEQLTFASFRVKSGLQVVGIAQVDEKSEVMLISHYGKIIRMDSTTIRESGRNAQGVRLLQLEPGDRVAAAVVIAPEAEPNGNGGTLIQ